MTLLLTRREFVRRSTLAAAALPFWTRETQGPLVLHLGVIDAPSDAAYRQRLGIELGIEEASHAARLFGGAIQRTTIGTVAHVPQQLSAVIGGDDTSTCVTWAERAGAMGVVYVNVGCTSDELRGTQCARAAFHVIPSDAMYRDAVRIAGASAGEEAVAWDASLSRFGADTLNQRFRARFKTAMTADSWAGWMAVKILWESALRQKSGDGAALATYLTRETTQFDGHKGQPLSFRSWDHQLRQPVYVVKAGAGGARSVREAPETASGDLARDALDRLGTPRASSSCRFAS